MTARAGLRRRYGDALVSLIESRMHGVPRVLLLGEPADAAPWADSWPAATITACVGALPAPGDLPAGVSAEVGRRDDPAFLLAVLRRLAPEIVVDAAARHPPGHLLALHLLFPCLARGGLYLIELARAAPEEDDGFAARLRELAGSVRTDRDTLTAPDALAAELMACVADMSRVNGHWVLERGGRPPRRLGAAPGTVSIVPVRAVAEQLHDLDNGGGYRRVAAHIAGAPVEFAEAFARRLAEPGVEPPAACVAVLRDVEVHVRGVVTAGSLVVRESLLNIEDGAAFGPFRRDRASGALHRASAAVGRAFADADYVLLKQTWDSNFGHWLYETLPRVDLVGERFDLSRCRFVVAADGPPNDALVRDTLGLFGIGDDQIEPTGDETLAFGRLIYPAPMTVQPWVKAPRVLRVLEGLPARAGGLPPGPERIYLSRGASRPRRLLNEDEIVPDLEEAGFVIATPEALSFRDQLWLFHDARVVAGNLGAALSLSGICREGLTLFVLATEFIQDDFFWDVASHKRGRYFSLHGKATEPALGMQSDFRVDVDAFRMMLKAAVSNDVL